IDRRRALGRRLWPRRDFDLRSAGRDVKIIDLRSDTVTLPSPEMRRAMANAELGDDVFGEDPTVNRLQAMAAQLLGKEAALLTTSGTQSNLTAMLTHCSRGEEVIVGDESHTLIFEVGGAWPVGSVLSDSRDFIAEARRYRKMLGGGMRQAGVLAAAGVYALENMVQRFANDHENARIAAEGLAEVPGIELAPPPQTNLVYF